MSNTDSTQKKNEKKIQTQAQNYADQIVSGLNAIAEIRSMAEQDKHNIREMFKWEGALEAIQKIEEIKKFYKWGDVKIRPIPSCKSIQFTHFENNKPTHEGYIWNCEANKKSEKKPAFYRWDSIEKKQVR